VNLTQRSGATPTYAADRAALSIGAINAHSADGSTEQVRLGHETEIGRGKAFQIREYQINIAAIDAEP